MLRYFNSFHFLLLLLIVCGIYIRTADLAQYIFTHDDLLHIYISRAPVTQILHFSNLETNAPLSYFIIHLFLFYPRLVSLLPGVLLIPSVFILGKKISDSKTGLILACLVTFSFAPVLLSQSVRQYSLYLFFQSWVLYYFESLKSSKTKINYCLFSLTTLFCVATNYIAALPTALIFIIGRNYHSGNIFKWLIVHLPSALFLVIMFIVQIYPQWVLPAHSRGAAPTDWLIYGFPSDISQIIGQTFAIFSFFTYPDPILSLMVFGFLIWAIIYCYKKKFHDYLFLTIFLWLLTFILSRFNFYPYSGSRHFLHVYLPFIILTAYPLSRLLTAFQTKVQINFRLLVIALILTTTTIISQTAYYRKQGVFSRMEFSLTYKEVSEFESRLKAQLRPSDLVLTDVQTSMLLNYYSSRFSIINIYSPGYEFLWQKSPVCARHITGANTKTSQLVSSLSTCSYAKHSPQRIVIMSLGWYTPDLESWHIPYLHREYYSTPNGSYLAYFVNAKDFIDYAR